MIVKLWQKMLLLVCGILFAAGVHAEIPKETYDALKLDKSATSKQLYEALVKRYKDPAEGAGRGTFAQYWEPIAFSKYLDPASSYKPPSSVKDVASRQQCVKCHADETPVWVNTWKKSAHANLDNIRRLTPKDATFYKKAKLEDVEKNLRSLGKLAEGEQLKEVGCIDCHVDVNTKKSADHRADLRMPTADVCANCHLQEFAERESERDTITWPKNQWPKGRPSHALDAKANYETSIWAGMPQREIAEGCTMCHQNQNKCDTCHTRHEFSVAESRKPQACATCHNGVDHNNWEAYSLSKHGKVVEIMGSKWNWDVPLKDAFAKGGQSAPTCQSCHMEYQGKFSHNMVRKVRWANYPAVPGIAENIKDDWSERRLEAWVKTCTNCHSESLARSYLDMMDKGTLQGLAKYQEAHKVVEKLYADKLLPGQTTNRPTPPPTEKEGVAQFFQLFWTKGNNPSSVEMEVIEMGENDLAKLHVGMAHVNPGGWTYTEGWEPLSRAYSKIMSEDTKLREMAALQNRVAKLEAKRVSLLDGDSNAGRASLGGLGGALLLAGGIALAGWRRRDRSGK
ncbi:hydroxylamine reductase [Candidatus Desulfobacillus denitrificans]|uniref:Hydroxylamine oxidoreductase n=1 Tax=Candidatus Desulfobacillus denitrificans TaxID=2608985 RepID=A0A809R3A7_9PROT|nr:hydroxylamine reductase [Candidatus Desulfobacillus denitrificans]